jgi:hypothetical protein
MLKISTRVSISTSTTAPKTINTRMYLHFTTQKSNYPTLRDTCMQNKRIVHLPRAPFGSFHSRSEQVCFVYKAAAEHFAIHALCYRLMHATRQSCCERNLASSPCVHNVYQSRRRKMGKHPPHREPPTHTAPSMKQTTLYSCSSLSLDICIANTVSYQSIK